MTERTHLLILAAGGLAGAALGLAVFALPAWKGSARAAAEQADLEQRMAGLSDQTAAVTVLTDELDHRRGVLEDGLKRIPDAPDVASLMRSLSLPADNVTVLDQTFTAGASGIAIIDDPGPERVVPLTIDMHGRFDAVFALMRQAESMQRLVRIGTVRLAVDPKHADDEIPLVEASVGLEVVYVGDEEE